jgi:type II secretory pathway predicted ATPase ExeA
MVEAFFGFKKTPFCDNPDAKQLYASQPWTQVKARLQFLLEHQGAGLLTGEVGAGKSIPCRSNPGDRISLALLQANFSASAWSTASF